MTTTDSQLPIARFKERPEDFVVEEVPAYLPSGAGEHLYVTLRKTGRTTPEVVRALCRQLEVDPAGAGWAGMKDKHATTVQTVSVALPVAVDPSDALSRIDEPGLEILSFARHGNKLKPGHLLGNRFEIRLRGLSAGDRAAIVAALENAARRGVPNFFGPQRFGRDGDNPTHALAWLAGTERGPRDRKQQRFWFSALQSLLFDDVLRRRVSDGTWCDVLPGDLAKRHDSGGMFLVALEGSELDDARARAEARLVSATGPMFGASMRWPEGPVEALERSVLEARGVAEERLVTFRSLGEGTRRPLRMLVEGLSTEARDASDELLCRFTLPKGGYATTLLATCCTLVEPRRTTDADGPDPRVDDPS
jgi:tRNA pseudouridine13 synthase